MAIPEQIRKQTEAIDKHYAGGVGAGDDDRADDVPNTGDDEQPDGRQVDVGPTGDKEQAKPEGRPEQDDYEAMAQRYRSLQGKYNAEVPRLTQDNREMSQRISQLEALISTMTARQSQQTNQPATPQAKLITDTDVEEYGDAIDVMRRASREEYAPLVARLAQIENTLKSVTDSVVPQVRSLSTSHAQTAEQHFWAQLTQAVPTWKSVNDNPDFQTWLLDTDPFTGITRQSLLEDAQRNLDAARVINFFNTWLGQTGTGKAAQTSRKSATELEKQVAPGRGRSSGGDYSGSRDGQKTWSTEDIAKFYDDVRKGRFKGREEERARIERDIFAAQAEGRLGI